MSPSISAKRIDEGFRQLDARQAICFAFRSTTAFSYQDEDLACLSATQLPCIVSSPQFRLSSTSHAPHSLGPLKLRCGEGSVAVVLTAKRCPGSAVGQAVHVT